MKSLHIDTRAVVAVLHDTVALAVAILAATYLLDMNGISQPEMQDLLAAVAVAIPMQVGVNVLFGLYRGVWRYTSLPDIQRIVFAVCTGALGVSSPAASRSRVPPARRRRRQGRFFRPVFPERRLRSGDVLPCHAPAPKGQRCPCPVGGRSALPG